MSRDTYDEQTSRSALKWAHIMCRQGRALRKEVDEGMGRANPSFLKKKNSKRLCRLDTSTHAAERAEPKQP
jgi:hypothetical protein